MMHARTHRSDHTSSYVRTTVQPNNMVLEVQWNDMVFSTFGPWMHLNVALIAC